MIATARSAVLEESRLSKTNFDFDIQATALGTRVREGGGAVDVRTRCKTYVLEFSISHGGDAGSFDDGRQTNALQGVVSKEDRGGGKLDEARKRLRTTRKQDEDESPGMLDPKGDLRMEEKGSQRPEEERYYRCHTGKLD
ncbi:hypothetical protein NX059_002569 [Plenodomus lindquistii]|nr:hypothetical protein NX059_002569 [Plenodomus lindquistii]